jgi:hypothetical protein
MGGSCRWSSSSFIHVADKAQTAAEVIGGQPDHGFTFQATPVSAVS